jgi:mannose-6-phosphate isomerase-like protein (cupin superfamily)
MPNKLNRIIERSKKIEKSIKGKNRTVTESEFHAHNREKGKGHSYPHAKTTKLKKGFATDLEKETRKNADFRRVLYTGRFSQLVLMNLKPGEEIGEEVHDTVDQFFRFEEGEGMVIIDNVEHRVRDGSGVVIPSGARHNVLNTSSKTNLKLYTIYSPPEHQDKVVRHTKADALKKPEEYDGKPTE